MKGIIIFLAAILVVNCTHKSKDAAIKSYLKQFGFIDEHKYGGAILADSIRLYQRTFELRETGVVDKETEQLMHTPRCGVKDLGGHIAELGSKWDKQSLTYSFKSYTRDLPQSTIKKLTARALNTWGAVTNLVFSKRKSGGDIKIEFARGQHGTCMYPFYGPGGVLAHAYFPWTSLRGQVHFDDDEHYTTNKAEGINYLWVATHEFGHTLGLDHDTSTRDAVMYPYYRSFDYHNGDIKLHYNDQFRIQRLYGSRVAATSAPQITKNVATRAPVTKKRTVPRKFPPTREVCFDRPNYCSRSRNQCNTSKFMLEQCPRTCGFCKRNRSGCFKGCRDYSTKCGDNLDKCRNYTSSWTRWQKKHCARSCGFCCKA